MKNILSFRILSLNQLPILTLMLSQSLYKASGYIDIDKIDTAAWPALVADLAAEDQSITALAFGRLCI